MSAYSVVASNSDTITELLRQPRLALLVVIGDDDRASRIAQILDKLCYGWELYDLHPRVLRLHAPADEMRGLLDALPGHVPSDVRLATITANDQLLMAYRDADLPSDQKLPTRLLAILSQTLAA